MIHPRPIDQDEASDTDDDFDLILFEENGVKFQFEFNSHCKVLSDDQDELLLLDDLFPLNNNQNTYRLYSHTTIKTHDFCTYV